VRTVRALPADRLLHLGEPRIGTMQNSQFYYEIVRRREEHRPGPSSDHPASGMDRSPIGNQPKGAKLGKKEL
jgi:hypothetical protein